MKPDHDEDSGPSLGGIVAFVIFCIATAVAALLAAAWAGREADPLSPHHFEKGEDGLFNCQFDMSKIGMAVSSAFAALVYAGLPTCYLGVVAVGMGFPEIGSTVWWAVIFAPSFIVTVAVIATRRFDRLSALQSLVWNSPLLFKLNDQSAMAVGFLSAKDFDLYKLYSKAVPKPAEASEWTALAGAGATPADVGRWAFAKRSLPPPPNIETICHKIPTP